MDILLGNTCLRIYYVDDNICLLNGIQRFDDAKFFNDFMDSGASADTGGIDQNIFLPVSFEGYKNTVACGARNIADNNSLLTKNTI